MRRTPLARKGKSDTALIKGHIQALLRQIVIARDGGCILRDPDFQRENSLPACGGYGKKSGELIIQCDHLVTRANSATYAEPRLCVALCASHHYWKSVGGNMRKKRYDDVVRQLLEPERVELWDKMEAESWKPQKTYLSDWQKSAAYLQSLIPKP